MTVLSAPPLFLNQQLVQRIRSFHPLGIYSANDFRFRVTENQKFFLAKATKDKVFECEIDGFILREMKRYSGPKTNFKDSHIFVIEYFEEGDLKGQRFEDLIENLFKNELTVIFPVSNGERNDRALNEAKAYRKRLEASWDKLWVPYK